jgi:AbrB family looped-hinge helix DNA binding protein
MAQGKVSGKYQVCIPREIRERLKIRKGQDVTILAIGNRIEIVPNRDLGEMKGAFPGLSLDGIREEEDRF